MASAAIATTTNTASAPPVPHMPWITPEYLASLTPEDREAIASINAKCEYAEGVMGDFEDDGLQLHIKSRGISVPRRQPGAPILYSGAGK